MARPEFVGGEDTIVILPNGDYVTGQVVVVNVADWTHKDLFAFDDCPRSERAGLANVISAIRDTYDMSVVEITIKRS